MEDKEQQWTAIRIYPNFIEMFCRFIYIWVWHKQNQISSKHKRIRWTKMKIGGAQWISN